MTKNNLKVVKSTKEKDSERNYLLSKFNLLKSIGLLNSDYLKLR